MTRLKDDKDLEVSENVSVKMDSKTRIASLTIAKATIADSGSYSCVAYGESGGHAATTSNMQVHRKFSICNWRLC